MAGKEEAAAVRRRRCCGGGGFIRSHFWKTAFDAIPLARSVAPVTSSAGAADEGSAPANWGALGTSARRRAASEAESSAAVATGRFRSRFHRRATKQAS